ncbi:VWA domain-containing protein [Staphylococcus chromogenes]|nr:VWA domain-containing protein [Staphylococcus chromogenes]
MGKHRSAQSNSGVSKELIVAVIGVLVLIAAVIAWFALRGSTSTDHSEAAECPQGKLTVPYATVGQAVEPRQLFDEFLATSPKTQDFCVNSFEKVALDRAAFVITDQGTPATTQQLSNAKRVATTDNWPMFSTTPIGIALPEGMKPPTRWSDAKDMALVAEQPGAAAMAALASTGGNNEQAAEKLKGLIPQADAVQAKKPIAASEQAVPSGYRWVKPEPAETWPSRVVPLAATTAVSEAQSRAGAEFAKFFQTKGLTASPNANAATALATSTKATAHTAALPANTDTLILLDTSDRMSPQLSEVANIVGERAKKIGAAGAHVGLWNYSSPLNPGVTKSWRNNIALTDNSQGANAATALGSFGTGGVPNTNEALLAAHTAAQEYRAETNREVRILLITTGTADQGYAQAVVDQVKTPVAVIHVGADPADPALAKLGKPAQTVAHPDALGAAVDKALGLN